MKELVEKVPVPFSWHNFRPTLASYEMRCCIRVEGAIPRVRHKKNQMLSIYITCCCTIYSIDLKNLKTSPDILHNVLCQHWNENQLVCFVRFVESSCNTFTETLHFVPADHPASSSNCRTLVKQTKTPHTHYNLFARSVRPSLQCVSLFCCHI